MTAFSQDVYVALGRLVLWGEAPPEPLKRALPALVDRMQGSAGQRAEGTPELELFFVLLIPLWMVYRTREHVQAGKLAADSEPVANAAALNRVTLELVLPQVATYLTTGNADGIRLLATAIDIAKTTPEGGNLDSFEAMVNRIPQGLGLPGRKFHKKTQRFRSLLPLWFVGFGDLSEAERNNVFEKIGLTDGEIPGAEALRKMLSFYRVFTKPKTRGTKNPSAKRSATA